jgi:hypothetical protein
VKKRRRTPSKDTAAVNPGKRAVNVGPVCRRLRQSAHREADRQFSFIRGPEPQKTDSSASGLEDGGLLPWEVMAFKLFVKSRAGARNADEFGSRLRVVTLIGGKFSEVRARCTSGRRRTTSVTATVEGSGGSGTFGGGTVGGLRSARRALKRAKSSEGSRIQGPFIAHRIAPPVLPLRERPPPTLLGNSPCTSPSIRDRSTEPISVLPLRARPPGLMRAVRCRAMPALRCGLLTALRPLFTMLKLLRRRRKRGAPTPPSTEDVTLALLDARPRCGK